MSTIKEIAQMAGVSMMTVSRALNSPEKVKDDVREKILSIAKALEYRPNQAARALAAKKTGIVQVVVMSNMQSSDPYFMNLFVGIADYLSANNYSIQISRSFDGQNRCDGIITMGLKEGEDEELYQKAKVPCVVFGKTNLPMDWVDVDNKGAIVQGIEYLTRIGHKNIGFIALQMDEPYAKERLEGYLEGMKQSQISIQPSWISYVNNTSDGGIDYAKALLVGNPNLTAVVCSSDLLALGVLEAAKLAGKEVPSELSIIGMDGIYLDKISTPYLSTVEQPVYQIGRELAQMLLERMEQPSKAVQRKIIPTRLVLQGTTSHMQ
ncbi:MAG: LacI family DNA-binding transcriptional regulator [Vallitaleaceae bacterium]|nr:LacI family DNA-binding transcriptional regulator [Vallitaleaceae bacterium]